MTYLAKVTETGELVLPSEVVAALSLRPGDGADVDIVGELLRVRPVAETADTPLLRMRRVLAGYSIDQFLRDRAADGA